MASTVASIAATALALARSPSALAPSKEGSRSKLLFENSLSTAENMNAGVVYTIANPRSNEDNTAPPASFPYYGEFFEVLTPPITYNYSEVFWRTIGPVPLPDDIVERYNGSAMAVTGWEVDVVRKLDNGTEVSVPCFESYNHHYSAFIYGAGIQYSESQDDGRLRPATHLQFSALESDAGTSARAAAVAAASGSKLASDVVPGVQAFNEHNGNEARQSYHGLPRGTVQPIMSPNRFVMNPMQINTRNPDGSGTRGGPLPRESQAPPGALYSGLLECPCTTRIVKTPSSSTVKSTRCADAVVLSAQECFAGAAALSTTRIATNRTINDPSAHVAGCFVTPSAAVTGALDAVFNSASNSSAACVVTNDPSIRQVTAATSALVSLRISADTTSDEVNMTLSGPSDAWFAVGLDAESMTDLPWTVVVSAGDSDADPPTVTERRLGVHEPGRLLPTTQVKIVANQVEAGVRTVTLTRTLKGVDGDRYSFDAPALASTSLNYISAVGATRAFDGNRHKQSSSASLSFVTTAVSGSGTLDTCICRGDTGTIGEVGGSSYLFDPQCMDEPLSDLERDHNPTCDLNSYRGGLYCCKDGFVLLDQDQAVPPQVDTVYYKWRFYFEDFAPQRHTSLVHLEWQFGHIEYDVPPAPAGTPPAEAVHTLTTRFTTRDLMNLYSHPGCDPFTEPYCADTDKAPNGVRLIMAGGHCHAPACLDITLFNNDTGEMLCRVTPTLGQGDTAMDEAGYLWLPPCEWGSADEGMLPPPVLHLDTNLISVKRVNSTVGHTGVMAIWQARGAYIV